MNRIEDEWLHLKRHELGSQWFEHEYDLAITLIDVIEQRGQRRGYAVERFIFNQLALINLLFTLPDFPAQSPKSARNSG